MAHWAHDSVFYHIYPLGFCGAPARNDFSSPANPRLEKINGWLDHLQDLGVNALYLGPLFESSAHGYDTADYYRVDRRLGTNETLSRLSSTLHQRGIRLILDGVFHHVGRDFWAFRDVLARRRDSAYCGWFHRLDFDKRSPFGDPFGYEGWNGHFDLVKLNLQNAPVKDHLFGAVEMWIREFAVDGLRLDAADCLEMGFLRELSGFCRSRRSDFWLMGEVVHGDYRKWANRETLDSVTNYAAYKGLYSSHVDKNYFEIAFTLRRQFGDTGVYRNLPLYAFADNHDVNRVASNLRNPAHLYPLYTLLFTMPGVPSIYYGSEWGIAGKRTSRGDGALRPCLDLHEISNKAPHPDLPGFIARLAKIRLGSEALRYGDYRQILVRHEQFVFSRESRKESILVALNAAEGAFQLEVAPPPKQGSLFVDLLNGGETFRVREGKIRFPVTACGARILKAL